jgi:hypothetical protein
MIGRSTSPNPIVGDTINLSSSISDDFIFDNLLSCKRLCFVLIRCLPYSADLRPDNDYLIFHNDNSFTYDAINSIFGYIMSAHIYIDCHHRFRPFIFALTNMEAPNSLGITVADDAANPGNAESVPAGSVGSSASANIPPPENPIGPLADSAGSPAPAGTPVPVEPSADHIGSPASGNTPASASGIGSVSASGSAPVPASGTTPVPASGGTPVPENPVRPSDASIRSPSPGNQGPPSPLSSLPHEGISTTVQKQKAPIHSSLHFRGSSSR